MQVEWPLVGRDREIAEVTSLLRADEVGGVVLVGPGGVGKTRLANECLQVARDSGFATARAVATRASSRITLGAMAPLLPNLGDRTINLLVTARDALRKRAGEKRLVLFADDAHLLDDASASLVLQLAADREVFVLATVRSGEDVSDAITDLWKDGHARRFDVKPLAEDEVDRLIRETLGDAVDATTHAELRRISRGNPLALRELILGALEAGSLAESEGGRWALVGPLQISERLADLVEDRLGTLDAAEFDAIEFVALGEPLSIDVLERLTHPGAVESIERKGLITVRADDDRLEVWLDHPLFGEVLRANMGPLRTRNVTHSLADALEASATKRPGDVLRLAIWRLESGSKAEPELLVAAARQALSSSHLQTAHQIIQAAWDLQPGIDAGELLAYSLCDLGRFDEAEEVLARTYELASSDRDRVLLTQIHSELYFRSGRADEAIALEASVETEIADEYWRGVLTAHRATQIMLAGRPREAIELAQPLVEATDGPFIAGAAITMGTVLTWDGRPDDAFAVHEKAYARCLEAQERGGFVLQEDAGIQLVGMIQAMTQAGRLSEANEMLTGAWRVVSEQRATIPMAWIALLTALHRGAVGQPDDALHWGRIAMELWRSSGLFGRMRWPHAAVVQSLALLGRADEAKEQLDLMDAMDTPVRFNEGSVQDARAWVLAASGALEDARKLCSEAADLSMEMGQRTCAGIALHSLARLGDPAAALERTRSLLADYQGDLFAAKAAHIEALAEDDGEALVAVSHDFEKLGAWLFAAEAAADGARAYRKAGRARDGTAAAQRSRTLAAHCEGARTPALALAETISPLTRREREVALLASQGLTSKAIAERLYLSVRTVDNHLSRAYEKLGVSGRDDLSSVVDQIPVA